LIDDTMKFLRLPDPDALAQHAARPTP